MQLSAAQIDAIARRTGPHEGGVDRVRSLIQDNPEEVSAALARGAAQERDRWRSIETVAGDLPKSFQSVAKAMCEAGNYTGHDLARLAVSQMRLGRPAEPTGINGELARKNALAAWAASPDTRRAFANDQATFQGLYLATAEHNARQKAGV